MENNFKTIKDSVTRIIFESYNTGDQQLTSVYKGFLNEVKKSPILKTLYAVYSNVENTTFTDKDTAEIFLNENLFSFGSFSKKDIISATNEIKSTLKEHTGEVVEDKLFELILESTKDRKLSNLHKKAELFNTVASTLVKEEVIKEEVKKVDVTVVNRAIEILNEKYSFFNEREQGILKAFLKKDESSKKEHYNELISETKKLVKRLLAESEDESLENLLVLTEEKLNKLKYNSELRITDYVDLINLQKDFTS